MKMPLENLQSLVRCPVCNKKYKPAKMLVLDEDDKRTTLHLACDCGAAAIAFVSMGQLGVMSVGMLTDLEQAEARRAFQAEAISSDQVIEMHQFLKKYDGGIEALV